MASSILLFLLEVCLFSVHWLLLLAGIFLIVRRYCYRFRFLDTHMPDFIAGLIASAVFCQLLNLAHESNATHFRDKCPFLFTVFFPCEPQITASYLWKLNVFTVVARLLGDLLKIAAGALGDSAGTFISRLFGSLPWLLYLPSIALCSAIILFSTVAFFRYQLSVLGIFTLRPTSPSPSPIHEAMRREEAPAPRHFPMVKEFYQRCVKKLT